LAVLEGRNGRRAASENQRLCPELPGDTPVKTVPGKRVVYKESYSWQQAK